MAVVGAGVGCRLSVSMNDERLNLVEKTINKNDFITSNFNGDDISSFTVLLFFFQWKRMFSSHAVFTSRISPVADNNGRNKLIIFHYYYCYGRVIDVSIEMSGQMSYACFLNWDNIIIISARSSKRQQHSKSIEFFESLIRMRWNNERIK